MQASHFLIQIARCTGVAAAGARSDRERIRSGACITAEGVADTDGCPFTHIFYFLPGGRRQLVMDQDMDMTNITPVNTDDKNKNTSSNITNALRDRKPQEYLKYDFLNFLVSEIKSEIG